MRTSSRQAEATSTTVATTVAGVACSEAVLQLCHVWKRRRRQGRKSSGDKGCERGRERGGGGGERGGRERESGCVPLSLFSVLQADVQFPSVHLNFDVVCAGYSSTLLSFSSALEAAATSWSTDVRTV